MKLEHAKLVLDSILEGCEDEDIIKKLIDEAWNMIKNKGGESNSSPPPTKAKGSNKKIQVNERSFRSVKAACKFFGMEKRYTTVLSDIERGVHLEDIFPREPPTPKTRMNVDPRDSLVTH